MQTLRTAAQLDLSDQTDEDLLAFMSMQEDDARGAEAAFAAFHDRHVRYVYGVCRRVAVGILDDAGIEDLAFDTFIRVYSKAATFKPLETSSTAEKLAWTRAWLCKITTNLFRSILRGQKGLVLEHLDDEQWDHIQENVPAERAEGIDSRVSLVEEAIDSLNEKEQRVIRVTFQWHPRPLPHDVSRDLASELKTTNDYIRHIRMTARRKIEEYVLARLKS